MGRPFKETSDYTELIFYNYLSVKLASGGRKVFGNSVKWNSELFIPSYHNVSTVKLPKTYFL